MNIFKNLKIAKACKINSAIILKPRIFALLSFIIFIIIFNFMIPSGIQKRLFAEESSNNKNNMYETDRKTKVPFIIPLNGPTSLCFREEYFDNEKKVTRRHTGIDISGEFNQAVLASGNGIITYIGISPIGGRTIVIRHNAGIRTTYLNLLNIYVSVGDYIQQGEKIATVGAEDDPSSQDTHLHFGIIYGDFYLDPTDIFKISYSNISRYIKLEYLEDDFKLE
ncbi:M23 family metallopeptidase [bacterium]|nr:M23 family metallopeptidase [bacterium]